MAELRCPVVVGRERELARARTSLDGLAASRGGVLAVAGEAGVGKSRLVQEIAGEARARAFGVLVGRAVPDGAGHPYRPLTEALLQALRDRPSVAADPVLAPWLVPLGPIVPTLSGEQPTTVDEDVAPAVRGEGVLQILRRVAGGRPLLLVLEDLHWADPDTLAILEYLADNLAEQPVLCLATHRGGDSGAPAVTERLEARGAARTIALSRLSPGEVETMARACRPDLTSEALAAVVDCAEGLPFLVEELAASQGVSRSFAHRIRARVAALGRTERSLLRTATVLGSRSGWRLLGVATGLADTVLEGTVHRCVAAGLLRADRSTVGFRHQLTRDAVTAELLAPEDRTALATGVIAALDAALPGWDREHDGAADLMLAAGDAERAGTVLMTAGRAALARGALATAVASLGRARELVTDRDLRAEVELAWVEALSQAGHVDEARRSGERALAAGGPSAALEPRTHVVLARSAVDAADWDEAEERLGRLAGHDLDSPPVLVLRAEVALGRLDADDALGLVRRALAAPTVDPSTACHAETLTGRILRGTDLDAARAAFERALAGADEATLPIWRLRALHELGTIDMFARGLPDRLEGARRLADELGAPGVGAMIDLQLSGLAIFRFEPDEAARRALSALEVGERLGLTKLSGIVLVFLAEAAALRRDVTEMHRWLARARAAAPGDPEIEGSAHAGALGMYALLGGDVATAVAHLERGIAELDRLPHQGPAPYRGLWPLLLAARGDPEAASSITRARRDGLTVSSLNAGLLGWADAVLAGRAGDAGRANDLARAADHALRPYGLWADLGRMFAAEQARTDRWGTPEAWSSTAADSFARHHLGALAARCRATPDAGARSGWARLGITAREADVLRMVAEGCPNKTIASRLHLSPRTVEKHVEALLRKTDTRTRTQLVAVTGPDPDRTTRHPR